MLNSVFSYKINQLYGQDSGSIERHHTSTEFTLDSGKYPVDYDISLIKTDGSIVVILENFEMEFEFECSKCLKKFINPISIESTEREFLFERPREIEDENDLFMANLNTWEIDIEEMLRQEILLHFPLIPLCSTSCKGLCYECGKDQNREKCKHSKAKNVISEEVKPFSQLKNLIS